MRRQSWLYWKQMVRRFARALTLEYLQKLQSFRFEENLQDSNHLKDLFLKIYTHPKIVIAQVQGHALAGGCALATVCDFVASVPTVKVWIPEVKLVHPGHRNRVSVEKTWRSKNPGNASSGELFSADQVLQMGLINYVDLKPISSTRMFLACQEVSGDKFCRIHEAHQTHDRGNTVKICWRGVCITAAGMNAQARGSDDCKRGITAFLNKELSW